MSSKKWQRIEGWVGSEVEDRFVLLNIEGGDYISFNKSATDIWEALASPVSQNEIVDQLTAKYDVTESNCQKSVQTMLNELVKQSLIQSAD